MVVVMTIQFFRMSRRADRRTVQGLALPSRTTRPRGMRLSGNNRDGVTTQNTWVAMEAGVSSKTPVLYRPARRHKPHELNNDPFSHFVTAVSGCRYEPHHSCFMVYRFAG